MEIVESLELLAERNISGIAFLAAYGTTWLICGAVWWRASERVAAFVTLFQGMVALPAALGLSALIGAAGQDRPVGDEITQLSILIGTSQLLGLPFVVYLVVRHEYALVPYAFASITSMHFVLYSWLYQTPVYIVMAVVIPVATTVVMFTTSKSRNGTAPMRVSLLTGTVLLVTAAVFLVIHW